MIMTDLELERKVEEGAKFSIDFKKRTLKINGKNIDPKSVEMSFKEDFDGLMTNLKIEYNDYKYSVPSERSEKRQRNYFKALPYEELDDHQMCYGMRREKARFILEFHILKAIVDGLLTWQKDWGSWFWQSDTDKDFVILREWIEPQQDK